MRQGYSSGDGFRRHHNGRAAGLLNAVTTDRRLRAQEQDQVIQFIDCPRALSAHSRHPPCRARPHGVVM